jgi:hypothetical protein
MMHRPLQPESLGRSPLIWSVISADSITACFLVKKNFNISLVSYSSKINSSGLKILILPIVPISTYNVKKDKLINDRQNAVCANCHHVITNS